MEVKKEISVGTTTNGCEVAHREQTLATLEVRTLDKDLTIDPTKAGGVAHIIQDQMQDTYEGCGFDAACNYAP